MNQDTKDAASLDVRFHVIFGALLYGCRLAMRKLLFALLLTLATPAVAEPIEPSDVYVIDGDTINVFHVQPNVRLVGFNAPESSNAACEAERQLGVRATQRLLELVQAGYLDFEYVTCSCPAAKQGTRFCNWGRDRGTLRSNGRDVGDILIAEGLAVPFICGPTRCPKKPHLWCGTGG
jgi:endonuclease YncB( thermonuclease family)